MIWFILGFVVGSCVTAYAMLTEDRDIRDRTGW